MEASTTDAQLASAAVADTVSQMVDALVDIDRTIAGLMGLRAAIMDQAREWSGVATKRHSNGQPKSAELQARALRAELASALKLPERTIEAQLATSESLVHELPATLTALRAGEIGYRHAQLMAENAMLLSADARASLERAALPYARNLTAAKFERKVRALRELADPDTIRQRRERAVSFREVSFSPARDGMVWLNAYIPAEAAVAIHNRLTEIARASHQADGGPTVTQLRADAFTELLVDGEVADNAKGIRATVFVTVPVLTLLGLTEEPATLDGYGPIDAGTARYLAGTATSFIRLLTHPETGAVLSVGRDSYRVPKDLKNWLRVRDGTCRFPCCSRPARYCDIDHTQEWVADHGETNHDNLAHLCRGHHTVKSETGWRVQQSADGTGELNWTSPAGRSYMTHPETRLSA